MFEHRQILDRNPSLLPGDLGRGQREEVKLGRGEEDAELAADPGLPAGDDGAAGPDGALPDLRGYELHADSDRVPGPPRQCEGTVGKTSSFLVSFTNRQRINGFL